MDKFSVNWCDKDGNKCYSGKDEEGCYCFNENIQKIEIPMYTIHKILDLSEKTKIEIHSCPSPPAYVDYSHSRLPNLHFSVDSHIDIITSEPREIEFFYAMIYRLCEYFTSLGIRKCQIKRIYDWQYLNASKDFYNNHIPWRIKDIPNFYDNWFTRSEMSFDKIENELCDSIKLFLDKHDDFHNLIQFNTDMNNVYIKEYTETYLSQQIQVMETYGNMKLCGQYLKNEKGSPTPSENVQDLEKTISEIPNDVFDKIFIHNYLNNDLRGWAIFGNNDINKPMTELKDSLRSILTNLRNYIIHPYQNGTHKKVQSIPMLQNYCYENRFGLSRNIGELSSSLKMLLRWLLYKEIGLDKHFTI